MYILCQKCGLFLVMDGKVHFVIKGGAIARGDHYYCPKCRWECIADFGKWSNDHYLIKYAHENDPDVIDLDNNVFAKEEPILDYKQLEMK